MAQIEKTNQIDKYLDQIDKKEDSSFKKKVFLIVGLLLISVTSFFAYNQFSGKESLAENSMNSANASNTNDSATSVYVNDDSGITDDELIAELEAEEAAAAEEAALLAAAEAEGANGEDAETPNVEVNSSATNSQSSSVPGISTRSYTAEELAGKITSPSSSESRKVSSSTPEVAAADVSAEEIADEVADEFTEKGGEIEESTPATPTVEEIVEEAPEPESVVEEAPKGITKEPSFPGGESKMRQFFARKITYPSQAIKNKVEGNVNVKIKVNEKGKIVDSQVVKGIGSGCDREVLRAINRMPKWEPAMENGKVVAKHYLLSVAFKLPN